MYTSKDYENCCRLCLKDLQSNLQPGEKAADGYFRIAEHRTLQLMILNCFEILITDDEPVNKICSICKDEVHHVDTIRKKAQAADSEIKDFYEWLRVRHEIKGSYKPPKKPITVSGKVNQEVVMKVEQNISPIQSDTEEESSVQEIDHEEKDVLDETGCPLVKYEHIKSDSIEKVTEIDVEKCTTKESHKPLHKTKPVKRKYKQNAPKIYYSDYRCFICSTDFANQDELSSHLPTHAEPDNLQKCSICNLDVVTVRNLNLHLRRTHFRTGKKIPCEECLKDGIVREYSCNTALGHHKRTVHEGIAKVPKSFICSHCGKNFTRAATLAIHENTHTRARSYPCKMCSSSFTSKAALNRHEDIHIAGKPFVCDLCGTAFRRSFNLQMHKANRHSDDRPFSCDICAARFKVRMALSAHIKTHGKTMNCRTD